MSYITCDLCESRTPDREWDGEYINGREICAKCFFELSAWEDSDLHLLGL
jgi:hypothetical protein